MNAIDIGTRFVKRLDRIANAWTGTPLGSARASRFDVRIDGDTITIAITEIVQSADPRPCGYDHLTGDRPRYDHIRIAEMLSKHIATIAGFSKEDADIGQLDVWHKRGTAGFLIRTKEGTRFMVETHQA
jgi:hypothetical protein